ncbi:MAG: DUF5034 domain-containing protein [Pedobacter sp.]|nr:MAG: DUF5034 domain-containing protein [Pedobacter sp.]
MMIKKIIFVFAIALSLQLISGCVDCNCGPVKDIYFTKKGLSLKNLDGSLPEPKVTKDSVIGSAKYGIQMQFATEQLALNYHKVNWGLMSTAMACSCEEDNVIGKEDILAVAIFSNNDFDASHPKNTDLSLYFKAKLNDAHIPIDDYLKTLKDLKHSAIIAFYQWIFLQQAPTASKNHKFRVKINLSDGRVLEAETTEVQLR